jgi:hypothetical protein
MPKVQSTNMPKVQSTNMPKVQYAKKSTFLLRFTNILICQKYNMPKVHSYCGLPIY